MPDKQVEESVVIIIGPGTAVGIGSAVGRDRTDAASRLCEISVAIIVEEEIAALTVDDVQIKEPIVVIIAKNGRAECSRRRDHRASRYFFKSSPIVMVKSDFLAARKIAIADHEVGKA